MAQQGAHVVPHQTISALMELLAQVRPSAVYPKTRAGI